MDWMEQEQERGITITAASTTCFWRDHRINIIDTPGHVDFTIEVERSLRVLDGAVAVFCAVGGVEPQSRDGVAPGRPATASRASPSSTSATASAPIPIAACDEIRERLRGARRSSIQIPNGLEDEFSGVVDLIDDEAASYWEDDTLGATSRRSPRSPPSCADAAEPRARDDDRGDRRGRRRGDGAPTWRSSALSDGACCARRCAARRVAGRARAGAGGRGVQEQGRAAAARRGGRLPAVAGRHPAGRRARTRTGSRPTRSAGDDEPFSALAFKIMRRPVRRVS